ncbi:hypothetical protein MT391_20390 [Vibrio sp. 1-Bac 57]
MKRYSQGSLWKTDAKSEDHRFYIESDLLANCIGYGHAATAREGEVAGFTWSKHSLGYALLGYLVERALGFSRLPFCMDRVQHWAIDSLNDNIKHFLESVSERELLDAIEELKELYDHTQKKLSNENIDLITLTRQIKSEDGYQSTEGYAESLMKLKVAAEYLELNEIEFEMDLLNSYSSSGSYQHWADVTIDHNVNPVDIIYCSALVGRKGIDNFNESGEWVVINRSSTGKIKLPTSSISYKQDLWKQKAIIRSEEEAIRIIEDYKFPLRGRTSFDNNYGEKEMLKTKKKKLIDFILNKL